MEGPERPSQANRTAAIRGSVSQRPRRASEDTRVIRRWEDEWKKSEKSLRA